MCFSVAITQINATSAIKALRFVGRGGGIMVSILAFYSDDPSSNPADNLNNFQYKKTKTNEEWPGYQGLSYLCVVRNELVM